MQSVSPDMVPVLASAVHLSCCPDHLAHTEVTSTQLSVQQPVVSLPRQEPLAPLAPCPTHLRNLDDIPGYGRAHEGYASRGKASWTCPQCGAPCAGNLRLGCSILSTWGDPGPSLPRGDITVCAPGARDPLDRSSGTASQSPPGGWQAPWNDSVWSDKWLWKSEALPSTLP